MVERRGLAATLACAAVLCGWAGGARPAAAESAAVARAVFACRAIAEPKSRLVCYDQAASALDRAVTQGRAVVIDREQVQALRRQSFGTNLPALPLLNAGAKDEGLSHVLVTLESARQDGEGKWVLDMSDGAAWRQIGSETLYREPHKGSRVAIRRAMLGSFFCNVDGQPAIRCVRDR